MNRIALLVALSVIYGVHESHCGSLQDSKDLLTDCLEGYNKNLRPVENQAFPLVVYVGFELVSISDVNEVTQTVTINGLFALNWVDVSMRWDPSKYGYIYHIFAENDQFWTPTLVLTTSTEKMKKAGNDWLGVRFIYDGVAHFYPGEIFESSCSLDITYYPFDQHECLLTFIPWGQTGEDIYIYNTSDKVKQTYFSPSGAWEFVDSEITVVSIPGVMISYNVKLIIRRLPRYIIINVIVPVVFLSLLNMLVFLIPTESGERISFCITLLLAIAVFLTIISDNLPKTSFPMSYLSYYLLAVLVISNCITLATIFGLTIYYTDDTEPINCFWKCLASVMGCKCFGWRKPRNAQTGTEGQMNRNKVYPLSVLEAEILDKNKVNAISRKVVHSNVNTSIAHEKSMQNDNPRMSWKVVSTAFDRVCFIFFFVSLVVLTGTLFGVIVGQSSNGSNS